MDGSAIISASSKALGTYELLEKILFHLGSKGLFNAQQVCREWRTLASRSKTLRACLILDSERIETNHDRTWWVNSGLGLICRTESYLKVQPNPLVKLRVIAWRECSVWERNIKEEGLQDILSTYTGFWKYILNFRQTPYQVELQTFQPNLDVHENGWTLITDANGERVGSMLIGTIELLGYRNRGFEAVEDEAGRITTAPAMSIIVDVICTIDRCGI